MIGSMMTFESVYLFCIGATLFVALRVLVVWPQRLLGCDAFYIRLSAESFRSQKRLPIVVPDIYQLERPDQWYPPGFMVLCGLLPKKVLQKYYWLVNHVIDLTSALLLFIACLYLGVPAWMGLVAILCYAVVSGSITEFSTLNTRPFGLLLLNVYLFSAYWSSIHTSWLVVTLLFGALLVFSHKLTMQQLWFTLPCLSIATQSWYWLGLLFGCYLVAFLIWPRGAWRVCIGHYVIVRFWHRNWGELGAHAVKQSPIYGDGETLAHYYAPGGKSGFYAYAKDVFHQNYFIVPLLVYWCSNPFNTRSILLQLSVWVFSVYFVAIAVHAVPRLRAIGLGRQYLKFAIVPSLSILAVISIESPAVSFQTAAIVVAVLLGFRHYGQVLREAWKRNSEHSNQDETDLCTITDFLIQQKCPCVFALPYTLCDRVAYITRQSVYWGTHSDVFDERLYQLFPVLRQPMSYFVEDGVTHLLLDTRYVAPAELELDEAERLCEAGSYVIISITQ